MKGNFTGPTFRQRKVARILERMNDYEDRHGEHDHEKHETHRRHLHAACNQAIRMRDSEDIAHFDP